MKYLFAVVSICVLGVCSSGCSGPKEILYDTSVYALDFTEYAEDGFLITPEGYPGDEYESIGIVQVSAEPGVKKIGSYTGSEERAWEVASKDLSEDHGSFRDDESLELSRVGNYTHVFVVRQTPVQDAIKILHDQAVEMGADAIIRFEIVQTPAEIGSYSEQISLDQYELSGLAIRRHPDN